VRAPHELFVDPPKQGGSLDIGFVVPKPAEITASLQRYGREVARAREVVEAGEQQVGIAVDPNKIPPRATYRVMLTAFDGNTRVQKTTDVVLVRRSRNPIPWIAGGVVAALVLVLVYRRRRSRRVGDVMLTDETEAALPSR
jgi:hypothetical protein